MCKPPAFPANITKGQNTLAYCTEEINVTRLQAPRLLYEFFMIASQLFYGQFSGAQLYLLPEKNGSF